MKKLIIVSLIAVGFTGAKAQSDFSEFSQGKIGYGIDLGWQMGVGGINGFGSIISPGIYGCYDVADWLRFFIAADYSPSIGLGAMDYETGFFFNQFLRVPAMLIFKVGGGSIGVGAMQNIFLASNKIKQPKYDYNLNSTYAIVELNNIIGNYGIRLGYQINQLSLVRKYDDHTDNINIAQNMFIELDYRFDLSDFFGNYKSREKAASARKRKQE